MARKPARPTQEHFVYLYRDSRKLPRYVGYGRSPARAFDLSGHNEPLRRFAAKEKMSVEICGPFRDKDDALSVETVLISAHRPDFNRRQGSTVWRFRPLGVDKRFADRLARPSLTRVDFRQRGATPALFVKISEQNFHDRRVGYNPVNPPTDRQILERMEKWWVLGRRLTAWRAHPERSPRVLVGVYGPPGAQIVIGAVKVEQEGWEQVKPEGGKCPVPTLPTPHLDAFNLRGRHLDRRANIKFGRFDHQHHYVLG